MQRNIGLDITRSMAILLVLMSHCRSIFHYDSDLLGEGLWRLSIGGLYGVELFFVLSGFLIGRILIKSIVSAKEGHGYTYISTLKNFWIRRWFRTLPLYWLMLIVNCVFWYYFPKYCWNVDPVSITWKHLFFIQNYDSTAIAFFPESWSLCVEEWFYLSIPIMLIILLNINKHIFRNILALVIVIVAARFIYVLCSGDGLQWDYGVRKNIFLRMDALGIGVLLAYISLYRETWFSKLSSKYNLLIGASGVAAIALMYVSSQSFVEGVFAKTIMFDVITISWGLVMCYLYHVKVNNNLLIKIFTNVSKISYSLYLVHFPIFICAAWYTNNIDNLCTKSVICLSAWIMAFMIAYVTYTFYEFPIMNLRDRIKSM
mgnify:CR=1 FL=1